MGTKNVTSAVAWIGCRGAGKVRVLMYKVIK
jgi:hypothetical protein